MMRAIWPRAQDELPSEPARESGRATLNAMRTQPIPSSGEPLPVIGLGTYRSFDVGPGTQAYGELSGVLTALAAAGGSVIDTSPMYGRAEQTIGDVRAGLTLAPVPFIATKVWVEGRDAGIRQMQRSFERLRVDRVDLMQIHNLVDWRTHLATLRQWKDDGRIRYLGVTHWTSAAYADVERILRAEPVDFLQINYALTERDAEARLLPLAADRGVAVLANRPLGQGTVLSALRRTALPAWALESGLTTWAAAALAFVVSHPAITCAIPATGNAAHMTANAHVGLAPPLTSEQRQSLAALV